MREEAGTPAPAAAAGSRKLTNQFNYSERASQTYNNPYRVSPLTVLAYTLLAMLATVFFYFDNNASKELKKTLLYF